MTMLVFSINDLLCSDSFPRYSFIFKPFQLVVSNLSNLPAKDSWSMSRLRNRPTDHIKDKYRKHITNANHIWSQSALSSQKDRDQRSLQN